MASLTHVGGVGELGEEVVGISRHFDADDVEHKSDELATCVSLGDVVGASSVDFTVQGEFSTLNLALERVEK